MPPRIAFYAPLKPPTHPIPSGDREMARNLLKALDRAGFAPFVASETIAYTKRPSREHVALRRSTCEAEAARLIELWRARPVERPDLWFTYHPYCKAPDWIGPAVVRAFGIPYVTAEACRTRQDTDADWAEGRAQVQAAVRTASVNFCLKPSDRDYLASFLPDMTSVTPLAPFIDLAGIATMLAGDPAVSDPDGTDGGTMNDPPVLLAVGMMRPGAKMDSYSLLAETLAGMTNAAWRLVILGDGPGRNEAETLFAFAPERITFAGALPRDDVLRQMRQADIFVWPGVREAFGVAYMEAQAMGLPVASFATAGVPVVVADGETGLLAPALDTGALGTVLRRLLADRGLRRRMGAAARTRIAERHGIDAAAATLRDALSPILAAGRLGSTSGSVT